MTKRNPVAIILFTLLTFGLYAYYWLYSTSEELRRESGRRDITPLLDALLAFLTVGVWGVWAGYRNARIAHELFERRGAAHTDKSLLVAGACVASFVVGPWAWLVAIVMLQEDLNKLSEPIDYFEPAREHHTPRVRVDVEPPAYAEPVPARARSASNNVAVFESSAPAPFAY